MGKKGKKKPQNTEGGSAGGPSEGPPQQQQQLQRQAEAPAAAGIAQLSLGDGQRNQNVGRGRGRGRQAPGQERPGPPPGMSQGQPGPQQRPGPGWAPPAGQAPPPGMAQGQPGPQQRPGPGWAPPAGQAPPPGMAQGQPGPQQQPGPAWAPPAGQAPPPGMAQGQPGPQQRPGPGWAPPAGQGPPPVMSQGQPGPQQRPGPGWAPPAGQAPPPGMAQGQPGPQQRPGPGWAPPAGQGPPPVMSQGQPGPQQRPGPGWAPSAGQAPPPVMSQGQPRPQERRPASEPQPQAPPPQPKQPSQSGQQRDKTAPHKREAAASPARSTASSTAGSEKGGGKKSSPQPQIPPVKMSLPVQLQRTLYSQIPHRKNPNKAGTAGRPITVETNMMAIKFEKNFKPVAIHYDVKFDPDKPRFMYRPVIEAVRLKHYPNRYPVFDGRNNIFSAGKLPFGDTLTTEIDVENPQRQTTMTFKVILTKAQDIEMTWLQNVKPGFSETDRSQISIQALDVILRASSYRNRSIPVGRSFFTPPAGRAVDLGNGMDLWIGTFQSAVLGWKPYFNIDVAHKAFPRSQPVIDLFNDLCADPRSNQPATARDIEYNRRKLTAYLKGLKVTYEIPGHPSSRRTMGINDLGKNSKDATFELADGTVTTVESYFAREKRYRIRYPDYPTLWVGSRNKTVLIPAELCVIEAGQVTNKKLDERQTSAMIRVAATDTASRKKKIMDGFAKMRSNEDPTMKEFGISVSGGFETVKARVLDPPPLFDKRQIHVKKGVWRPNSFFSPSTLPDKSWTILNLNDRTQEQPLRNLVQYLMNGGRAVGMKIGEPLTPFKNMRAPMRDVREIIQFFNEKKQEGLKLIIVVVPDKTGPVYGKVKQVAELNVGVLTQCIKAITVERKMNDATAGNILLKINSKLNGTNQIFAEGKNPPCLNAPCIIIGADVTHPSPDAVGIPSIAAVAASHGPRAFRYNVQIRLQPPKTEIILHLEEIIKQQLMFFYKSTGHKPLRIIFYRDGVSEGQFVQVMHHELQAIRNACKKLGGSTPYQPKITFLVVQKRHHIRLFPTDRANSDDRNGNVQAGTVVDTDITHPSHIDFYLVSHASIQGTARPTKYRCLWDDSDMSEDEIEQLTYYLCHMFSRCTRSVSYPAPTYYAHLAAFRARALTNEVDIRLNNLEEEQRTKMTIKSEILTGNPMFFV